VEDGEPLAESVDLAHCPICLGGKEACEELGEFLAHNGAGHAFHKKCLATAFETNKRCPICRQYAVLYYAISTEGRDSDGKLLVRDTAQPMLICGGPVGIGDLKQIILDKDYDKFSEVMRALSTTICKTGFYAVDPELIREAFFYAIFLKDLTCIGGFVDLCLAIRKNPILPGMIYQRSLFCAKAIACQLFNQAINAASVQGGDFALFSVLLKHQDAGLRLHDVLRTCALLRASQLGKRDLVALLVPRNHGVYAEFLEKAIGNAREHPSDETPAIIDLLNKILWKARIAELCNIIFPLWLLCIIPYAILDYLQNR
jgi:hypothetical protein